jgi:hypothetical protein
MGEALIAVEFGDDLTTISLGAALTTRALS